MCGDAGPPRFETMSRQTLELVRNTLHALNERDVDRYLSHCTRDVRLESPVAAIEGAYEGPRGIRRLLATSATRSPTSGSRSSARCSGSTETIGALPDGRPRLSALRGSAAPETR